MAIDATLLAKAQAAGAELVEAERQVELARAEHHAAIRRLHLAGATQREIAQALALSHQRVQQIVKQAGGTWWFPGRSRAKHLSCSWCNRTEDEVQRLIAGPKVHICDDCVARAAATLAGKPTSLGLAAAGAKQQCSFCRKRPGVANPLVTGPSNICQECLGLCEGILDEYAGTKNQ